MSNAYYGKYFSLEVVLTLLIRNVFSPDSSFLETHKKKKNEKQFSRLGCFTSCKNLCITSTIRLGIRQQEQFHYNYKMTVVLHKNCL